MYNKVLDTFRIVAEEGSFTKAADKLFITHTAIRKQINQLESSLGVTLFERSNQGLILTNAGQVMYAESLRIIKESEAAVRKVRDAYAATPSMLKIGTSVLYPCHFFMDLWDRIRDDCPQYQIKIISFDDDRDRLLHLGKDFDFLIGAYNNNLPNQYQFLQIGSYRFCLAVPRSNALSKRKTLSLKDLAGQPLMIMNKGTSPINDRIRADIEENYPEISIVNIEPSYDVHTFNRCVERGCILLSLECWDRVHPDIKSIPLKETYTLPFGIIYAKEAGELMTEFITAIRLAISGN